MPIVTQVSTLLIILSHSTITSHSLANGFPFSYKTVFNVNVTNISPKRFKLLQYNPFLNMLLLSITEFQCKQKVLLILLHRTSSTYMSRLTLLVTLLSVFLSNLTMLKMLLNHFYTIGPARLVQLYILLLIVDPNKTMLIWHEFVLLWIFVTLLEPLTLLDKWTH